MVLCKDGCTPCCDFCIYVHREYDEEGIMCSPDGCLLHEDKKHQELAERCSWCEDFHCFRAGVDSGGTYDR